MNNENIAFHTVDLKKIEKRAFLISFQDGIWDMMLGWVLISFGIGAVLYDSLPTPLNSLLGILLFGVGLFLYFLLKFRVSRPRIGQVKFATQRKKNILLFGITISSIFILSTTFMILVWTGVISNVPPDINMALVFGLIPLFIFSTLAMILKFPRMFLIGIFFAVAMFFTEFWHRSGARLLGDLAQIFAGIPIFTWGVVYFINFLRKYPKPGEAHDI
jgi:hypothetical protein